jgi:hypothetical protein
VKKLLTHVVLLWTVLMAGVVHASYPVYADGDLAPLGAPDGLINTADYLVASRIVLGLITPGDLEYAHGDLYPAGAPDGVINIQDMLLLQQQVLSPSANTYVENLDLFVDGPATLSGEVDGTSASTTVTVDGYTGPGATVINDPNFTDPEDSSNTIWHVAISGGLANVYLGTADLGSDPVLDTGYDLSGAGLGQLVFDIKVNSLSAGAILTIKIDSGYPQLGQVALTTSHYTVGSWQRVAINFADLLADPGPGAGLDLNNVVNAFVIEVTGGNANFYLDNIFVTHACPEVDACHASIKTKSSVAIPDWPAGPCRTGTRILPIDGGGVWSTYADSNGEINVEVATGCGGSGNGARMSFDLGGGEWVVASGNSFATPVDLTAYTHLWIPYRGTPGVSTALEIKLRDAAGGLSMARMDHGAGLPVWRSWAVDLREFRPQLGNLDLSAVTGLEVGFSSPLTANGPRSGVVEIGDLSAWNLAAVRPAVTGFERVNRDETAMAGVASDLLSRLRPHGFIPAWFELAPNWHLYANAMALIVFTLEYERLAAAGDPGAAQYEDAARLVADTLVTLQSLSDRGGAWDDSYVEVDGTLALHPAYARIMWVGSTAWAGIALIIARDLLPEGDDYDTAISAAAAFYASRQGCRSTAGLPAGSVTEGTEGNISSHLFLAAAAARGLGSASVPDTLATFIADDLYDSVQQRFLCGVEVDLGGGFNEATCTSGGSGNILRGDARSCLDVIGNWGAEWLVRQGRVGDALAGLGYARHVFPTQSFGDPVVNGLGDIAGPWTPSVEIGAGQWAAAGGPDASYVLAQAQEHLCLLGACQGAADNYAAGIAWNTTSPGIAPAAWMYLAWHGGFWNRF